MISIEMMHALPFLHADHAPGSLLWLDAKSLCLLQREKNRPKSAPWCVMLVDPP